MAINRDLIKFENGELITKTYAETFNMLLENLRAVYGEDIDTSSTSPQGNELRFLAGLFSQFALSVGDIKDSFDLTNARGQQLDNLLLFSTGLVRQAASFSYLEQVSIELPFAISDPTEPGQSWELTTSEGIKWISEPGTAAVDDSTSDPLFIYTLKMVCNVPGPHKVDGASTLSRLYINGTFITDSIEIVGTPIMRSLGTESETDRQFLTRAQDDLAQGSKTLAGSIKSLLLDKLPGAVKDAKVINSNGDADLVISILTDAETTALMTVPLHDIFVIVQPRAGATIDDTTNGERIAYLLQEQITPGIRTAPKIGSALVAEDSYLTFTLPAGPDYGDLKETVRFKVASRYDPVITVYLKDVGTGVGTTAKPLVQAAIRDKIKTLSSSYLINQEIDITAIRNQVEDPAQIKRYAIDDVAGGIEVAGGVETNYGYWLVDDADASVVFIWSQNGSL